MEKFLGISNVTTKAGEAALSTVLASKKYVMLYFSASWCGPCKSFTPKLVDFYNKNKESNNFEILFISRDRDEASFKAYYEHHPWPAIYNKTVTDELSSKLKINGIPSLYVVDAEKAEVISKDGRMGVMADAAADFFPWPAALTSTLFAKTCTNAAGESVAIDDLVAKNDSILLYFSASWCGPCKAFTPKLIDFYNKNKESKKFETIFLSLDRDEASFKNYFGSMPWNAVYGQNVQIAASILEVKGIPSLFVYDTKANKIVCKSATQELMADPQGAQFPWPSTAASVVGTQDLIGKNGTTAKLADVVANNDYTLLYFSASWCPPCKAFTPKLIEFYNAHKDGKKFEIIYMSLDRDEASFEGYYKAMPWYAVYGGNTVQTAAGKVGLEGVPTLLVVDKNGEILTNEGVEAVMGDPSASQFPWAE